MKRAIWAAAALADFDRLDAFYSQFSMTFSRRVGDRATSAARLLAENPMLGPQVDGGLRKWRVPTTDYIFLYRIVENGVEIARLVDARSNRRSSR